MIWRPSRRARLGQWLVLAGLAAAAWFVVGNAANNLSQRHVPFGFGYLANPANFDIPFHLIDFGPSNTYARALLVCLLNTLLVSAMGIVAATLLGLLVGVMRLSANWLVRTLALWFIELVRNTPMLVQIVFWYVAVLASLPGPRQSIVLPLGFLLNIRGLYLPVPVFDPDVTTVGGLVGLSLLVTPLLWRLRLGRRIFGIKALLPPFAVSMLFWTAIDHVEFPAMRGFNIAGGVQLPPELLAIWVGLSIYAAAFIAEIVRSCVQAVARGQREAALSLGLKPRLVMALVILPQAMRMMIPPLTSQYLNLIKSSSLGAAVAYPEIFQIFAGTVLNQSGRETETFAIVMGVFLSINLVVSAAMNLLNRRVSLGIAR
jgi:general L-amino acid transport system permease protein